MVERKHVIPQEQKTIIDLDSLGQTATVRSCEPEVIKELYSYATEFPNQCIITYDDGYGMICKLPRSWVIYKPPTNTQLAEEQNHTIVRNHWRH